MKYILVIIIYLISFYTHAQETFWNKSEKFFSEDKFKEANFYLALHLNHEIKDIPFEVPKVFQKLDEVGFLPTSFIDGNYSHEFYRHFFGNSLFQWNSNMYDEENLVILTRVGEDEGTGLYAAVWGRPRMELWSLIGNANSTSYLLGYSDADIVVGKYNAKNQPVPCNSFNLQGPISHIYSPTFFDVDRDNLPELLIRYNITVADGFIQYLDVYKSKNNRDFCSKKLMKQFSARNGFADYSGHIFITGVQTRSEGEPWLGASLHEITEIFFDGVNEKLIVKETKSNVLRGTDASYWE